MGQRKKQEKLESEKKKKRKKLESVLNQIQIINISKSVGHS